MVGAPIRSEGSRWLRINIRLFDADRECSIVYAINSETDDVMKKPGLAQCNAEMGHSGRRAKTGS
jgi:hypothetical protein